MDPSDLNQCERSDVTCAYAAQALPQAEMIAAEGHIALCTSCRRELESLRLVIDRFACWQTDVLRPTVPLHTRLTLRIAQDTGEFPAQVASQTWTEPEWEVVAPGIECKLLASDAEKQRVSMLVRLAPRAAYPAHIHAGTEELYLLYGELWIDDRKLQPGDYNYGGRGASDERVWSKTGCTCVLVTSTQDILQ